MDGNINLKKRKDESELEYILRIGKLKTSGLIDMTWQQLSDVFNENLREPGEWYTESAYRKKFASICKVNEEFGTSKSLSEETEEYKDIIRKLEKERVKIRDERTEYRRLIREEARKESYYDQIIKAIEDSASKSPIQFFDDYDKSSRKVISDTDMIVPFFDIHTGIDIDNFWNKYNENVLKERLDNYVGKILEIKNRHNCESAYVVLSELISGLIHPTLRIENNKDLIEQFLIVTEYISNCLAYMSYEFNNIYVYIAPGNHSRINTKKENDLAHENMDNLAIPFLRAKLQNYNNIKFYDNLLEQSMAIFTVRGKTVAAIHGDKDDPKKVVSNLWGMYHANFDIVMLGHRHTNGYFTDNGVKVVQSGCISGMDSYSIDIRKYGIPEQAVCVVSEENGLECIYDVKLK